jgi:polyisoprenoid-binding protein YceI
MSNKSFLYSIVAVLAIFMFSTSTRAWEIDKAHSQVGFTVKHMVVAKVSGHFSDFTGTVTFDENDISKTKISGLVQVASVSTDDEKRDNHLKSPDFFDAEQFPEIKFESKKIVKSDDGHVMVGELTIRDVTKEVEIPFEISGPIKDPWGATRLGLEGHTTINRQDFGVKWGKVMDNGGLIVSDDVVLNIIAELVKK